MEVGNAHVANTVNTVVMHHEIKCTVRFLVTVFTNQCVVNNRKTLSEWVNSSKWRSLPANPHDEFAGSGSDAIVLHKGALSSAIWHLSYYCTWEKGNEKAYKYHVIITYYYFYITYIFTYTLRETQRGVYTFKEFYCQISVKSSYQLNQTAIMKN